MINAGKQTVTAITGAAIFSSAESFAMIRGGHVDLTVLGAFEVDVNGDIASWMVPGKLVKGMGGAMDLVAAARNIIVIMTHADKAGNSKLLDTCTLPLTGKGCIRQVLTDLAWLEIEDGAFVLRERAPGVSVEEIRAKTAGKADRAGRGAGDAFPESDGAGDVDHAFSGDAARGEVRDGVRGALQRVVRQRRIGEPALRIQREHRIGHRASGLRMAPREAAPVHPHHLAALQQRQVERQLRDLAAGETDHEVAPVLGAGAQRRLGQRAADRVEHQVHAAPAGGRLELRAQVLGGVIDQHIGSQRAAGLRASPRSRRRRSRARPAPCPPAPRRHRCRRPRPAPAASRRPSDRRGSPARSTRWHWPAGTPPRRRNPCSPACARAARSPA